MRLTRQKWIAAPAAALILAAMPGASAIAESPGPDSTPAATLTVERVALEDALNELPEATEDVDSAVPRCDNPNTTWTNIDSKAPFHVPAKWNGATWRDGPGGTMLVRVEKAGKIMASITAGYEAEVDFVVAKAKTKVDGTIGAEFGISVGHQYSHEVTRNKYGHLQYGSWGYKTTWSKWGMTADRCNKKLLKKGTAYLPTYSTGWRFWETAS